MEVNTVKGDENYRQNNNIIERKEKVRNNIR